MRGSGLSGFAPVAVFQARPRSSSSSIPRSYQGQRGPTHTHVHGTSVRRGSPNHRKTGYRPHDSSRVRGWSVMTCRTQSKCITVGAHEARDLRLQHIPGQRILLQSSRPEQASAKLLKRRAWAGLTCWHTYCSIATAWTRRSDYALTTPPGTQRCRRHVQSPHRVART